MDITPSHHRAIPSQARRLEERHASDAYTIQVADIDIVVDPGVYQTAGDSTLMAKSVVIGNNHTFLEVGCGTGVVSLSVAKRSASGCAVDINERAVENAKKNALRQGVTNVSFAVSDVFQNVTGTFDVIICNPPYSNHEAGDAIDRMFWDPEDEMKRRFFREVGTYLNENGRIYFGWANFADIDVDLPFTLATESGYECTNTFSTPDEAGFTFYVFEFQRTR